MKPKYYMLAVLFASFSFASFAKSNTDTIKVAGNCGMCKSHIEKAAKDAGATSAVWDKESKILVVEFDAAKTSNMEIQKKVADAGYDTQDVKASEKSYNKLDKCCQYERPKNNVKDTSNMKGMNGRVDLTGNTIFGKGYAFINSKSSDNISNASYMECVSTKTNCCASCCMGI